MTNTLQDTKVEDRQPVTDSRALLSAGMTAIIVLFVGIGTWMYSASIQGAVIAPGAVSIRGQPKIVQHLDGGIVADIKVRNGDFLTAGEVLLQLDKTKLLSALEIYETRFLEAVAIRVRLIADLAGEGGLIFDDKVYEEVGIVPELKVQEAQREIYI